MIGKIRKEKRKKRRRKNWREGIQIGIFWVSLDLEEGEREQRKDEQKSMLSSFYNGSIAKCLNQT